MQIADRYTENTYIVEIRVMFIYTQDCHTHCNSKKHVIALGDFFISGGRLGMCAFMRILMLPLLFLNGLYKTLLPCMV